MATGAALSGHSDRSSRSSVGNRKIETSVLWKVHVGLVLVQLGYGSSYVLSKIALTNGVNPIVFAVYRDIVCLIVLIPASFFAERGKRTPFTLQVFLLLLALGFFGTFITQMLHLYGLLLTSAAYSSMISVLTPLFTFIISTSCGFEQIRWKRFDGQAKLAGLISAVFGAAVLAVYLGPVVLGRLDSGAQTIPLSDPDTSGLLAPTLMYFDLGPRHLGILCLFLGGFTMSLSFNIQGSILARYPAPISVSAFAYLFGAIMLFMTALLTVKDWFDLVVTEKSAVISYIYNGLVPAAFNFTMLIWCVQKAGPVLVGSYIPLQLFTAAALAYIFLGESIHLGSVVGTLLVVNGLGFITWGKVKGGSEAALLTAIAVPMDGVPITPAAHSLKEPLLG